VREYGVVSPKFWIGSTGRALRGDQAAQLIAAYLITSPHANMLGLYYLPLTVIAHETGSPFKGASKALRRVCEVGFASYDWSSEYVWVPEMARFQIGESLKAGDKRISGVIRELKSLANVPYSQDFWDKYHERFSLPLIDGLRRGIEAPSKPLRSQEQDQDQEQDQEQDKSSIVPSGLTPPDGGDAPDAIERAVALWNDAAVPAGLATVRSIGKDRRAKWSARIRERGFVEAFPAAVRGLCESSFARSGGWASFDWLIENGKNWRKASEGNYRDKPRQGALVTTDDRLSAYDALETEP